MTVDSLEAKAHEMLGQLGPAKLAAVVQLLEVMIGDDEELLTEEDRRRFQEGQRWFAEREGKGIPMDNILAEHGLRQEDFPLKK